jgi:hypothetical protein
LCAKLITLFYDENIDLIRLGLHYSESLEQGSVGNNYHPAFKELCEGKIFFDKTVALANELTSKNIVVTVNPKSVSKFIGQSKCNIEKLADLGYNVTIEKNDSLKKYDILVKEKN